MSGTASVIRADARALPLVDGSVDLVVTSPPYFAQRSYQDGGQHYAGQIGGELTPTAFVDALIDCTREMARVLKPTGSIFLNLGDKYSARADSSRGRTSRADRALVLPAGRSTTCTAPRKSLLGLPWRYAIRCVDELGLTLRAEMIWSKPNGLPESVTDRVRRSHEQWFHFTVQPHYFATVDAIRETHKGGGHAGLPTRHERSGGVLAPTRSNVESNPLGRLPGSVWEIPSQPLTVPPHLGADHFAAFPVEWPRRIIQGWSPEDGIVLDPFGGTGTTALAAKALGRRGVSIDMSADYCRIAEWRTNDPAELAKAMRVETPRVELHGQADLLELIGGGS